MISLQGSLKTCKADTAWAERVQSNRFQDPNQMVCVPWGGRDNVGRPITADSFQTKSAGCNSPMDRVGVENTLRPQYMENVGVDAYGFRSDLYTNRAGAGAPMGTRLSAPGTVCPLYPYDWNVPDFAAISTYSRVSQFFQHQTKCYEMLASSGFA